ncbi:MAG: DUF4956 domain-containing protein [Phycisphaerales bacterium]|nr:DUF4956 domain-containing protein [Phycisphaerales bacterium]
MPDWVTASEGSPLSTQTLLINLSIGLVLGVLIGWHYVRFGRTLCNRHALARILVAIVLTTVLVISVVKASLALSLGLVGALSIVRFRTPIKEPEELAYLFLSIATGLGLGADQQIPTGGAVIAILIMISIHTRLTDRKQKHNVYLNVELPPGTGANGAGERLSRTVADHVANASIRRLDYADDAVQATYFIDCRDDRALFGLIDAVRDRFPTASLSLIDQTHGVEG